MAQAIIDLGAVAHNVRVLSRAAGAAGVMAVVKADGFGHGAVEVARTALRHGATRLGVTSPDEALALRAAGIDAPMLLWLYPPDESFADVLAAGVEVAASRAEALEEIAAAAHSLGVVAGVHLEADTGLSRGGAPAGDWPDLVDAARRLEKGGTIEVTGLWSHLASAEDVDGDGLRRQLDAFAAFRRAALSAGLEPRHVHLANSAATLQVPEARYTLVRPGIGVYGVEPVPGRSFGLRPAMTVTARVLRTMRVPAGTGVSYGWDHVIDRETTLAQIPLGFADGVPRSTGGRAGLLAHGVRRPIVGRVTMDQVVLDVGDLPVVAGDTVVMFGPGDAGEPTVEEWAAWAGTNPHEILTGIGARVHRIHLPD